MEAYLFKLLQRHFSIRDTDWSMIMIPIDNISILYFPDPGLSNLPVPLKWIYLDAKNE